MTDGIAGIAQQTGRKKSDIRSFRVSECGGPSPARLHPPPLLIRVLNPRRQPFQNRPIYRAHSVTSADVRLSVGGTTQRKRFIFPKAIVPVPDRGPRQEDSSGRPLLSSRS